MSKLKIVNKYRSRESDPFIVIKELANIVSSITNAFLIGEQTEVKQMKYTQEVKDKAVEAAKQGVALKTIQNEIGPNPKAVMRYLAKAGIDYNELKKELKEKGELKSATKKQGKAAKKSNKAVQAEEIIEE